MNVDTTANNVTWFSSAQSSMPSINSTDPSGIIKILDACLVNGGIERSVLTVTINDNDVTLDFGSGHGFNLYQNIYISGSDDTLINGTHKIISSTNNTATINVVGALINTGVVKAKITPLGYESLFGVSDPLKRAYRSLASSSSKRVLYLDMGYPDSAGYDATMPARRAMVDVCEDMQVLGTQINSYTRIVNNKPTNKNGSLFWYQARSNIKSAAIDSAPVSWVLIGNGNFFYLCISWTRYANHKDRSLKDIYAFGEFVGLNPQLDATMLMASNNNDDATTTLIGELGSQFASLGLSTYVFIVIDGAFSKRNVIAVSGATLSSGVSPSPYPSSAGNFLITLPLKLTDSANSAVGLMPSLLFIEHNMAGNNDGQVIDGCLIVRTQEKSSNGPLPANVGFYVGV